jgi:hypothetical protein
MVRRSRAVRPAVEELEPRRVPADTFAAQQTFATSSSPYAVAWGDFNGDGWPALAVANFLDDTVSVFLNTTPAGDARVEVVSNRECAGHGTVFQGFEPGHDPKRARALRPITRGRVRRRFSLRCSQPRAKKEPHDSRFLKQAVCGIMGRGLYRRTSRAPGRWRR